MKKKVLSASHNFFNAFSLDSLFASSHRCQDQSEDYCISFSIVNYKVRSNFFTVQVHHWLVTKVDSVCGYENVIAGECAQPLSLLKIFHSTRDPDKKDWYKP